MKNRIERQFEQIAADAITAAEHVDCSLEDFADGLDVILDAIRDRKRVTDDEVEQRRKQREQEDESEEDDEDNDGS